MSEPLPFDDSRRLTGYNLYFAAVGAVLETVGVTVDARLLAGWEARVRRMRGVLGWPGSAPIVARRNAGGAGLAFAAPLDQLLAATEVNEWAWLAVLADDADRAAAFASPFHAPGHPAAWDEDSAVHTLRRLARAERNPALMNLVAAAQARGLGVLLDDQEFSIGSGCGVHTWSLAALPGLADIHWSQLRDVPVALVTGSNGKTTTTRLLAAMSTARGWCTAYTCTDGVHVGDEQLAAGDYSGPAGARLALRAREVEAAVLETARGGLLRRGLAVQHARVALVTNVSDDHFGEYGVHDLHDLAAAKLGVARALDADGVLVLNADDAELVQQATGLDVALAWFAMDADSARLREHRARGGATCGVRAGRLWLAQDGVEEDLGAVVDMPLSFAGAARYNISNLAAAALAGWLFGVAPGIIRKVLARFGRARGDNPGRLQHWRLGGVEVLVDYAHNPDGMAGLLDIAVRLRRQGRFGLLLGQAGNREDPEIRELGRVVAGYHPDLVVLKDMPGMLRGRASGEVAALLRDELLKSGMPAEALRECLDEYEAVRMLLAWARRGDVVVLPTHGKEVRPRVAALLAALETRHWHPGSPMPRPLADAGSAYG